MTTIKSLMMRLDRLEDRSTNEPDILDSVLHATSDEDVRLLREHASLQEAGFDEEQIKVKMSDRWLLFLEAIARFEYISNRT
jgi:hypothetical protein